MRSLLLIAALLLSGCATAPLTMPSDYDGCTTDDECENGARVVCVDYWTEDGLVPGECTNE